MKNHRNRLKTKETELRHAKLTRNKTQEQIVLKTLQ